MLVLGRHTGESIVIDGRITVTLLAASHGKAQIGIDAPRDVPICREELREKRRLNKAPWAQETMGWMGVEMP